MHTYVVKAWSVDPEAVDYYTVKANSETEACTLGKAYLKEDTTPWPRAVEAKVIAQLTPAAPTAGKLR